MPRNTLDRLTLSAMLVSLLLASSVSAGARARHRNPLLDAAVISLNESHIVWNGVAWTLDVFVETDSTSPICIISGQDSNDSGALMNAWCHVFIREDGRKGVRAWANLNWYPYTFDGRDFDMRFVVFQNGAEFYGDPETLTWD